MSSADDPERYEQVREHARGGLGRIVRAVDKRLGRTVAVKELLHRSGSSPANEARFLREALITARLEHPGIVPVHEAGRWPSGDPYYVMKLVEGRTLKELIGGCDTLRDRLGLLPHAIAVADAVGYAHSQGVIHRDLKPSNVVVGGFGETIVVDWGLARDCKHEDIPEPSEELLVASGSGVSTVSGKVIGTPAYMSPEQARGELVDERADVYAIGAVLYELLSGEPPHHDETPQATLERVIAGPPRAISSVPHVPGELATIVSKAMARDPDERYPNALALAEDLKRYQTGKLVSAHSYTAWSLLRKKLSAHRGVVVMALASAVALGAVGVESFRRVVAERNIAQHNGMVADDARREAEKRQRDLVLLQAVTSLRTDPTESLAWLKSLSTTSGYDLGDIDRGHMLDVIDEATALGIARHVFRPDDWVFDAGFTPDGTTVVAAVRDGTVRAYDLRDGTERQLGRAPSAPEQLAISPDGSVAITASALGEVTAFALDHPAQPKVLARADRMVHTLTFSPDRRRLLVQRESGPPQSVALDGSGVELLGAKGELSGVVATSNWSRRVVETSPNTIAAIEDGVERPLAQARRAITRIAMSPRGETVVFHDGTALWKVPFAGGSPTKVVDYPAKVNHVVWSPDGRTLAVCGHLHDLVLVDLQTGKARYLRGHTDAIYTVQWTRDGRRLLTAGDDGTARVWTAADGTSRVLRGHDDDVYRARFSADERQVVTASLDGSIRVWPVERPGARVLVEGSAIEDITLEGTTLRTTTKTETARWNLSSGHREPMFSWSADSKGVGVGRPSPDGTLLLLLEPDWSIEVRRRDGPSVTLRGHHSAISGYEFSRDGRRLYTSSYDGTLREWNLETGEDTKLISGDQPVRGFAIAADNRIAVLIGSSLRMIAPDGHITVVGKGLRWCVAKAEFERVRDRDRLLLRRCDASLAMQDGDRWIEMPTGGYHAGRIAVSPDGSQLASAMPDRTVRVWDANTGRVIHILRGHTDLVLDVAFSPNGKLLASASYDKTIRVWDLASERHRVLRGHALAVNRVLWRDDHHLVSGSSDGTLRIWEAPSMALPTLSELADQLDAATTARIDVDRPTTCSAGGCGARRGT